MQNAILEPKWLTKRQAREIYNLSEQRLRELREQQEIRVKVVGNRYLYEEKSLDEWFRAGSVEPKPQTAPVIIEVPNSRRKEGSSSLKIQKGGNGMFAWIKGKSKDGKSNGKYRCDMGDGIILEAKNGDGKIHYYLDYRDDEGRHTISLKKEVGRPIQDRTDAFQVARKFRNQAYEGAEVRKDVEKEDIIFSDFVPKYLTVIENHRSYKTKKNIIEGRLEPFFGKYRLVDLDFSKTAEFVQLLREEGVCDGTINNYLSVYRAMLNTAHDFDYPVDAKKVANIARLNLEGSERSRELTKEEEEKLFANADPLMRDIIIFDLNTGLRLSNVCTLKWTSVNFEKQEITISGFESKNKKQFKIHMNRTVLALLQRKQVENGHHQFVFMRNNGHPKPLTPRFVQYKIKELVDKVGIENFHFHDLRHTFGCRLVDAGIDLLTIKECMAHKSIQSTLVYVRANGDKVKKAFDSLDEDSVSLA